MDFEKSAKVFVTIRPWISLTVVANFVEVFLAKEGHDGVVGVNYLEKIQMTTPAAAYGAMLAGVDAVLMGAGIPAHIPAMLDDLAAVIRFTTEHIAVHGGDPDRIILAGHSAGGLKFCV